MQDVAIIVGGGAGISASCARSLIDEGMKVAVAAKKSGNNGMKPQARCGLIVMMSHRT